MATSELRRTVKALHSRVRVSGEPSLGPATEKPFHLAAAGMKRCRSEEEVLEELRRLDESDAWDAAYGPLLEAELDVRDPGWRARREARREAVRRTYDALWARAGRTRDPQEREAARNRRARLIVDLAGCRGVSMTYLDAAQLAGRALAKSSGGCLANALVATLIGDLAKKGILRTKG
jgi:hypothetical protein